MNDRVVAIECEIDIVPILKNRKHEFLELTEMLYILDGKGFLHCLDGSDQLKTPVLVDFSQNLEKTIEYDWSPCILSPTSVIEGDRIYSWNSIHNRKDKVRQTIKWSKMKNLKN